MQNLNFYKKVCGCFGRPITFEIFFNLAKKFLIKQNRFLFYNIADRLKIFCFLCQIVHFIIMIKSNIVIKILVFLLLLILQIIYK